MQSYKRKISALLAALLVAGTVSTAKINVLAEDDTAGDTTAETAPPTETVDPAGAETVNPSGSAGGDSSAAEQPSESTEEPVQDAVTTPVINADDETDPADPTEPAAEEKKTYDMYRLYNHNTGEHFYTGSERERDWLSGLGWSYEGVAWKALKRAIRRYTVYITRILGITITLPAKLNEIGWYRKAGAMRASAGTVMMP